MSWFRLLFARWLVFIDVIKGERDMRVQQVLCTSEDAMRIYLNDHSDFFIFCDEKVFTIHYKAWWARNRTSSIFSVYCLCSDNMNLERRERLSARIDIPSFYSRHSDARWQRKRAIECYLDSICSEMGVHRINETKTLNETPPT